jgi:hypothetical protein
MSIAKTFGPVTASNIRARWVTYVRIHPDLGTELAAIWDTMHDPERARALASTLSAAHGRVCHFFALLRAEVGDRVQDGAEHTAAAREVAARIAAHPRSSDWGPGGDRERWT